eukprot:11210228-Lingulodinium_polyedra.AAC.1
MVGVTDAARVALLTKARAEADSTAGSLVGQLGWSVSTGTPRAASRPWPCTPPRRASHREHAGWCKTS